MEIRLKQMLGNLAVIIMLSFFTTGVVLAEVAIIANKGITVDSITPKEAKKIWLGKKKSMPGGGTIKLADLPVGNTARKDFYSSIVKKKEKQLKAYWAKITFTGKGYPPQVFDDEAAVVEWVASTPGAMGYVSSNSATDSVKVLLKK
ncbi:MAG TPA: phosphate ABC transporter substrate-binding protein [Gammaproteobacteria bacterium]|nr:phosphate ABC transporter substrate-binding protein [Gammaproteobacteria bacterium]